MKRAFTDGNKHIQVFLKSWAVLFQRGKFASYFSMISLSVMLVRAIYHSLSKNDIGNFFYIYSSSRAH